MRSRWARVTEAQLVDSLRPSMPLASVHERLTPQRSVLTTLDGALGVAGQKAIEVMPLDDHLAGSLGRSGFQPLPDGAGLEPGRRATRWFQPGPFAYL